MLFYPTLGTMLTLLLSMCYMINISFKSVYVTIIKNNNIILKADKSCSVVFLVCNVLCKMFVDIVLIFNDIIKLIIYIFY